MLGERGGDIFDVAASITCLLSFPLTSSPIGILPALSQP